MILRHLLHVAATLTIDTGSSLLKICSNISAGIVSHGEAVGEDKRPFFVGRSGTSAGKRSSLRLRHRRMVEVSSGIMFSTEVLAACQRFSVDLELFIVPNDPTFSHRNLLHNCEFRSMF